MLGPWSQYHLRRWKLLMLLVLLLVNTQTHEV